VEDELQRGGERSLDGRAVDLAVALHCMWVAGVELSAVVKHRQVESCAGRELVEVDIAAPTPGWARADQQDVARGRDRHDAEERREWYLYFIREQCDVARHVELDDFGCRRGQQAGQYAGGWARIVHPIGHAQFKVMDADLQHVAESCAFHVDRASQHVRAHSSSARYRLVDVDGGLKNLIF